MLRRCAPLLFFTAVSESPSYRALPGLRHPLLDVHTSPYKEQFKEYWASPVPFADRSFGEKPRIGEPVPTRRAATVLVLGRNRHADADAVAAGAENDYKVLLVYREARGRYLRDQFVLPSAPVTIEDAHEDWVKVLRRRGATTQWPDVHHRLTAMRALLTMANLLLIPQEGGAVAEVEGPPGSQRWYTICSRHPSAMRNLVDVLELPMESTLSQLRPFCRVLTPTTETFRFDNLAYVVTLDKLPEVHWTLTCIGERLVWASPAEAIARYNAGIMNMPTPTLLALAELHNALPTFADVLQHTSNRNEARVILPMLCYHTGGATASEDVAMSQPADDSHTVAGVDVGDDDDNPNKVTSNNSGSTTPHGPLVATLLLPGDVHHADTTPADRAARYVRRFVYTKDYPYGVRAMYVQRAATAKELQAVLQPAQPALLEEATELDHMYAAVPSRDGRAAQQRRGVAADDAAAHRARSVADMHTGPVAHGHDGSEEDDDWASIDAGVSSALSLLAAQHKHGHDLSALAAGPTMPTLTFRDDVADVASTSNSNSNNKNKNNTSGGGGTGSDTQPQQ